jgi:hypothetical protein
MRVLVATIWLVAAPAALAQPSPAPEALGKVYACVDIADDARRLACFDTSVGALQQAQQRGDLISVDRSQAQEVERESFGFRLPALSSLIPGGDREGGHAGMEMTVARIVERGSGRRAFVMTNGQVWAHTEVQRGGIVRVGDSVTVRRAAMGSFLMSPSRGGAAHRVRRES